MERSLAVATTVACLVGVVGLLLPLAEAPDDSFSFSMFDIPYVGSCLVLLFAVLALLPLLDAVRGMVTFTPWLLVPALVGLVPLSVLELGLSYVPSVVGIVQSVLPGAVVVLGTGPDVLLAVDVAITLLAALAVASRVHARRAPRRATATSEDKTVGPTRGSAYS